MSPGVSLSVSPSVSAGVSSENGTRPRSHDTAVCPPTPALRRRSDGCTSRVTRADVLAETPVTSRSRGVTERGAALRHTTPPAPTVTPPGCRAAESALHDNARSESTASEEWVHDRSFRKRGWAQIGGPQESATKYTAPTNNEKQEIARNFTAEQPRKARFSSCPLGALHL